jgi:chromosome segregation ATPase
MNALDHSITVGQLGIALFGSGGLGLIMVQLIKYIEALPQNRARAKAMNNASEASVAEGWRALAEKFQEKWEESEANNKLILEQSAKLQTQIETAIQDRHDMANHLQTAQIQVTSLTTDLQNAQAEVTALTVRVGELEERLKKYDPTYVN